jgi:serine/threonine protein phosphatase PrpC
MIRDDPRLGLAAVKTLGSKQPNQDACAVASNPDHPLSAVVVADGVGSHYGADLASSTVADSLATYLSSLDREMPLDLREAFTIARARLVQEVEQRYDPTSLDIDWTRAFGTTAMCAVETERSIVLAYTGNGAIFHIRGNFNTLGPAQLLPWSALNYLNPHSLSLHGKNAMYKLLSPWATPEEIEPSIIEISKDDAHFGDIVLCCTDGIYSFDQVSIGRDRNHALWISGEASMERFYAALKRFFESEPSTDALETGLETYLAELGEANLVTDDCTVGVVITRKALAFQAARREKQLASVPA